MRVAAVQFEHTPNDKLANLAKIAAFTGDAATRGVEVIAFPECCITGYWHLRKLSREELVALAEPVPTGPSSHALMDLARQHKMTIGAGLLEIDGERMFNTWVVAMPNGEFRRHRKLHAFESDHISAGSEYTIFDTPHGCRVGVLICYDCNIFENVRINALAGVDVLLAPHQTGGCASTNPHIMGNIDRALWDHRGADPDAIERELRGPKGREWLLRWLPSRAHDNGLFLVFSNGVGIDDDEVRTGNAMIVDPYGRLLTETWRAADDMVVADLDASLLDRCTGRAWLVTRRPELYRPIAERTGEERDTRAERFNPRWM